MSAISGGDIAMGALTGAISAEFFGLSHGIIAAAGLKGVVAAGVHVGMAAAQGATNAAITGGDPGMGAITSGISAGISRCAGGFLPKDFGSQLAGRMATGAVTGGITSKIMGGDFGHGAFNGAWTSGFAFLFNEQLRWWQRFFSASFTYIFGGKGGMIGSDRTVSAPTTLVGATIDFNFGSQPSASEGIVEQGVTGEVIAGGQYFGDTVDRLGNPESTGLAIHVGLTVSVPGPYITYTSPDPNRPFSDLMNKELYFVQGKR